MRRPPEVPEIHKMGTIAGAGIAAPFTRKGKRRSDSESGDLARCRCSAYLPRSLARLLSEQDWRDALAAELVGARLCSSAPRRRRGRPGDRQLAASADRAAISGPRGAAQAAAGARRGLRHTRPR